MCLAQIHLVQKCQMLFNYLFRYIMLVVSCTLGSTEQKDLHGGSELFRNLLGLSWCLFQISLQHLDFRLLSINLDSVVLLCSLCSSFVEILIVILIDLVCVNYKAKKKQHDLAQSVASWYILLLSIFEILGSIPEKKKKKILSSPFMSFFKISNLGDRCPKIQRHMSQFSFTSVFAILKRSKNNPKCSFGK